MPELIYQVLEQDHKEIKAVLAQIQAAEAPKERERLCAQLEAAVLPHSEAEEATLYRALRKHELTKDLAEEGNEEHRVASKEIGTLKNLPGDNEKWPARAKVLKEIIEHHIREEEERIFDKARDVLSEEEALEIAERFREMKSAIESSADAGSRKR